MLGASKCLPLVLDVTNVRAAQEVPRPGTLTARIPDNNAKLPCAYLGLFYLKSAMEVEAIQESFADTLPRLVMICPTRSRLRIEVLAPSCTHALLSPLFSGILQGDKIETMGQLPFTTHLSSDLGGCFVLFFYFLMTVNIKIILVSHVRDSDYTFA